MAANTEEINKSFIVVITVYYIMRSVKQTINYQASTAPQPVPQRYPQKIVQSALENLQGNKIPISV